jgi:hypothetical protein
MTKREREVSPDRLPIDDDAEEALMRLLESTQNLQRRVFRSTRRGFLTKTSVAELQYDGASIARDIRDLAEMVGIGELAERV